MVAAYKLSESIIKSKVFIAIKRKKLPACFGVIEKLFLALIYLPNNCQFLCLFVHNQAKVILRRVGVHNQQGKLSLFFNFQKTQFFLEILVKLVTFRKTHSNFLKSFF